MTVDELVKELERPIFNLRRSAWGEDEDSVMGKSCKTRANNARKEIDEIVRRYVNSREIQ